MKTQTRHPTAAELVAYALGELAAQDESRLRRHVEDCEECRDLAQDLAAFPDLEPPGDAYAVGEEELRATRGKLRTRMLETSDTAAADGEEEGAEAKVLAFATPDAPRSSRTPMAVWWGVAATFVLVFGWGISGHRTAGRLDERVSDLEGRLAATWANGRPVKLFPAEDPKRTAEEQELALADGLFLILDSYPYELPPSPLTAEVRTPDGETVRRVEGLVDQDGGLTFALRPGDLRSGEYRIVLVDRDGEELPMTFELRLTE